MSIEDATSFAEAFRLEHTLNERQRDVIGLVAQGKTNPEIAAHFDMTLNGAKWNVSEVLTKLGFSAREEIAAYYRWRQQPSRRLLAKVRAIAGLPLAKWAVAGSALVAVGAGIIVVALSRTATDPPDGPVAPFALEARVVVETLIDPVTVGTDLPSRPLKGPETSLLKWWYRDHESYRWEVERLSPPTHQGTLGAVVDGGDYWSINGPIGTFSHSPTPAIPRELLPYPAWTIVIGPIPMVRSRDDLTMLFSQGRPDFRLEAVGSETVLGRAATIFSFAPVSTGDDGGVTVGEGRGLLAIDEADWVILRHSFETPQQRFAAEVTRFDPRWKPDGKLLRFDPPPGLFEVPAPEGGAFDATLSGSSQSTSAGEGMTVQPPAGFAAPAGVPDTFHAINQEEELGTGPSPTGFVVVYAGSLATGPAGTIEVGQFLRVRAPAQPEGFEPIVLFGVPGFTRETPNGPESYLWRDGRLVAVITDGVDDATHYRILDETTAK